MAYKMFISQNNGYMEIINQDNRRMSHFCHQRIASTSSQTVEEEQPNHDSTNTYFNGMQEKVC